MTFDIDADIKNADWAKRTWDVYLDGKLVDTPAELHQAIDPAGEHPFSDIARAFLKLPVADTMPAHLRMQVEGATIRKDAHSHVDMTMGGIRPLTDHLQRDHRAHLPSGTYSLNDLVGVHRDLTVRAQKAAHRGAFSALYLSAPSAKTLAIKGGQTPDSMHVTLVYFGDAAALDPEQRKAVLGIYRDWSRQYAPLDLPLQAVHAFRGDKDEDGKDPVVALVDAPALVAARTALVGKLKAAGIPIDSTFDSYKPHVTLDYIPTGDPVSIDSLAADSATVDRVVVAFGDERHSFDLTGVKKYSDDQERDDHGRFAGAGGGVGTPAEDMRIRPVPGIHEAAYDSPAGINGMAEHYGWAKTADEMDDTHATAFARYKEGESDHVDAVLRGQEDPSISAKLTIAGMDRGFRSIPPLGQSIIAYKSIMDPSAFRQGRVVTDPAFGATTLSRAVAEKAGGVVAAIQIPAEAKGVYMERIAGPSRAPFTGELLLDRGASYRVLTNMPGKITLDMQRPTEVFKYSDDQERDDHGRFAGPGSGGSDAPAADAPVHVREGHPSNFLSGGGFKSYTSENGADITKQVNSAIAYAASNSRSGKDAETITREFADARTHYGDAPITMIENKDGSVTFPPGMSGDEREARLGQQAQAMNEVFADRMAGGKGGTAVVQPDGKPQIWYVMGPPASGKSALAERVIQPQIKGFVVDADDVKARLPEYANGKGANALQNESSHLSAQMLNMAMARQVNIVRPVVGKTYDSLVSQISDSVAHGYDVHVALMTVSPQTALDRSVSRFADTGRFLSPGYVYSAVDSKPEATYARLIKEQGYMLASSVAYNNDGGKGEPPRVIHPQ